jgi:hypothetical protein
MAIRLITSRLAAPLTLLAALVAAAAEVLMHESAPNDAFNEPAMGGVSMMTTGLRTWRLWHRPLVEWACGAIERLSRVRVRHSSFGELDARTLRDIGIDGSELASIKAESEGRAQTTRLRILQGPGHV